MKKFTNSNFIKSIIDVDFLFLDSFFKSSKNSMVSYSDVKMLNLLETNKGLKQLVNILCFLKLKKNFSIYIWSEDRYFNELIIKFVKDFSLDQSIHISKNFPIVNNKEKQHSLLLVFGTPFLVGNKAFLEKVFFNKFFLVYKINLRFERFNLGSYKLKNNLDDYKKLLFVLLIILQILNKK